MNYVIVLNSMSRGGGCLRVVIEGFSRHFVTKTCKIMSFCRCLPISSREKLALIAICHH